jgi:TldD protein
MPTLTEVEPQLAKALSRFESKTSYAELFGERTDGHRVHVDRQTTSPRPEPTLSGIAVRAWDGEKWVEACSSGLQSGALNAAVDAVLRRLPSAANAHPPPGPSATGRGEATTVQKRPVDEFTLEERLEWATTRRDWGLAIDGIVNCFVDVATYHEERLFLNTAGARTHQRTVRTLGNLLALAMESGKVDFDYAWAGGCGGVEILDTMDEPSIAATAREALALLKAHSAPSGTTNVVLDPSLTGTFAHESFGHGTEADQIVRQRSYLAPLLGEQVGPESLTLVDNGAYPGAWGSIAFDDEGWPAKRNVLVEKGRFVQVLHDRESAAMLHSHPTGNVRRADFLSRPFVRMTNTYVEPGDQSLEELLEETRDGVLLQSFTSGIEDPLGGNMQLKSKKGRRIEHGELTEIYPSMALSGKVLEFLKQIRGVSGAEDFGLTPGFCGKGHSDMLVTGAGGPYLASRAIVGPA